LALGIGLTFLGEQMNSAFNNVEEFQEATGLDVIAEVPSIVTKLKGGSQDRVVTLTDVKSIASEQYSILAMKLRRMCPEGSSVVVAVTSASGGEGKTLTAVNLSFALARCVGKGVPLSTRISGDELLHERLGIQAGPRKGFGDLLAGPMTTPFFISTRGNLSTSCRPGRGRTIRLDSRFGKTRAVRTPRQEYKFIVLDSPPIMPIADGHVLAGVADEVLGVVRARSTSRELFKHAMEQLDTSNLLGVVLNDVDFSLARYSSAYQYYENHYLES
jgi:hypothetical protein